MLLTERRGPVALVTIDRAERRNALSIGLMEAMVEQLDELESNGTRAVVLTGAGAVFCSGADFEELRAHGSALEDALARLTERLLASPLPIVGAVNGPCVGGGVELAMACDIRVCDESAFFEIPATKLGVLYRPDGLDLLASRLPHQTVARLFHVNDRIPAADAVAAGLVAAVTPRGASVAAALSFVDHQQDLRADVVASTKARLREIEARSVDVEGWHEERARFMERLTE
jgi:enoyl-CoA hydratase